MNQPVTYKPADAIRWAEITAPALTKIHPQPTPFPTSVKQAFQKVLDLSKTAAAQVSHKALQQLEYRLYDEALEIHSQTGLRSVPYDQIVRIEILKKDAFNIVTKKGAIRIKPYAWLLVANVRVPLGWKRDGMEVPYSLLLEEIIARSKAPIVSA